MLALPATGLVLVPNQDILGTLDRQLQVGVPRNRSREARGRLGQNFNRKRVELKFLHSLADGIIS